MAEDSPEVLEERIESAEESGDTISLLGIIRISTQHATDEDNDDWAVTTEAALDAYYRLTKKAKEQQDGGLTIVFACLEAYHTQEAIVEVALGCIVSLASDKQDEPPPPDLPVHLIVSAMKEFPEEGTIQEQACLAVEGLAANYKEQFLSLSVQAELKLALDERITNERNKSYPKRAAAVLGIRLDDDS
ncbi:MAG: hypothetical protein SGILL_008888 [Bacillariaceae sp.]